jgi:hypothetical protein
MGLPTLGGRQQEESGRAESYGFKGTGRSPLRTTGSLAADCSGVAVRLLTGQMPKGLFVQIGEDAASSMFPATGAG